MHLERALPQAGKKLPGSRKKHHPREDRMGNQPFVTVMKVGQRGGEGHTRQSISQGADADANSQKSQDRPGNGGNTTGIGGTLRPNNNGQSGKKSGPGGDPINAYFNTSVFSQAPN
jgi:hypothetical protein